ncbi:MAG: quinone-interacting membrane-bound oxidoreductase complex subunit QmoC [Bacteroidetes bacterium]|nr:quinone-interacting membrane-bound oxidoreductase complex subunit QmoC [Bacteroidota bacterium]
MSVLKTIQPDIEFIREIKKKSGAPLKTCIQCGTCSVVCRLSPDDRPYPRKEMIRAAWGLKSELYGDPDIWLCHQCGECTTYCPRDVKPSDVLSALRRMSYIHYSRPRFPGKWMNSAAFLPLVIAIPIILITLILWLAGTTSLPEGGINYSKFFPHLWLNSTFTGLVILVIAGNIAGLIRFWKDMTFTMPGKRQQGFIQSILYTTIDVLLHKYFRKCIDGSVKTLAHFLVFWGFVLLLTVTLVAIVNVLTGHYPMEVLHPAKIVGNIAALMLTTGCSIMIIRRILKKDDVGNTGYFDWFLLVGLLLLTLTGILTELARLGNWEAAYYIYFIHLVMVWLIIVYLPYSKFGHFIFRILALTYTRMIGRNMR